MILPLQKLCLAAIRDSLKNRRNPYLHQIPPPNHRQSLRQDLLDLVLASGVIKDEGAYTSLSSPDYLDGLSTFSTQRGITSDREFLDLVADSLSVQQNGKTIGEGITELRLHIHVQTPRLSIAHLALNLNAVVRVISQCPNLKILHLSMFRDKLGRTRWEDENLLAGLPMVERSSDCGILNQVPAFAAFSSVLENVEELSFSPNVGIYHRVPCLSRKRPIRNFRCLSSLRLAGVHVNAKAWKEYLMTVKNSLIKFEASAMAPNKPASYPPPLELEKDWILPFPMPSLRSFKMEKSGQYTVQLIKNLMACPKLEKVEMLLTTCFLEQENEDAIRLLSQMNANVSVELGISLLVLEDRDEHFDRDLNFKWVSMFKEKIRKVELNISGWGMEHSMALENMFTTCHDLAEIGFCFFPHSELPDDEREIADNRLMTAVNSDLAPFLRDQSFVSKLRKLELRGPFDHAVLDALFENAASLESLYMKNCPQFSDSHLQLWASCGGKPEHLELDDCDSITDDGLVPILVSSGERMKYFCIRDDRLDRFSKSSWRALFNHCPFFDCPPNFSRRLATLLGSECPEIYSSG